MSNNNYWNRYGDFLVNGKFRTVPFLRLPSKPSDKQIVYKEGKTRLDKLSQEFYGTPYFGWLILQANPESGGLESFITDGRILTIPFPLVASLQDYKKAVDNHYFFYGKDKGSLAPPPVSKNSSITSTNSTNGGS